MPALADDPLGIDRDDPLKIEGPASRDASGKDDPLGIEAPQTPKFVSPIDLAPASARDIAESDQQGNPIANIGKGLTFAGKSLVAGAADAGKTFFRPLTDELYPEQATPGAIEQPTENLDALMAGEKRLPAEDLRPLPKAAQMVGRGAQGLIETTPRLAAVTGMQAVGVPAPLAAGAVFGATDEGFDPEQAAIAALLPFVGKYSGKMVEALASKLGVSKDAALAIFNKLGGATGAAAILKTVDEQHLSRDKNMSPQDREQARIDSWANIAAMSVLGAVEPRAEAANSKLQTPNSEAGPPDLSDLQSTMTANQVKRPEQRPALTQPAGEAIDPLKNNLVEKAIEELRSGEKVDVQPAGDEVDQAAAEAAKENPSGPVNEIPPREQSVQPEPEAQNVPTPQVKQAAEPESFETVDDVLRFRQTRLAEERDLYKEQIGLSDEQASKLQRLFARDADTTRFEQSLTPDQLNRYQQLFDGPLNNVEGPNSFNFWETDKRLNPEEVARETDPKLLASALVTSVERGFEEKPNNDRFLSAAIAARRLKELGFTKSDVARYLDDYTTRNSGSQGDKAELFESLGKKVNAFIERGMGLPEGDLAHGKLNSEPSTTEAKPEASSGNPDETAAPADPVLAAIAKAREVADPLRALKKGELHAMALPEWMVRTTADLALAAIEHSYKLGNTLYHAIEDGVKWLRAQNIPNFDEKEARDYLTTATREAQIAGPAKSRMEKFTGREAPAGNEPSAEDAAAISESQTNPAATPITGPKAVPKTKPVREVPPEPGARDWREIQNEIDQADTDVRAALKNPRDKQGQAMAAANLNLLREELYNHPDYVEHLLRQADELSNRIQEARDAGTEAEGPRPTSDLRRELENVTEALNQVPEKLRNSTYARLQDEGVIAKPERKPIGRTLDSLTDDMREMNIDSPRRTLRQRLALGRRVAERLQGLKDASEHARVQLAAAWKVGVESIKSPPTDNGFRNMIKDWIFYDQLSGHQTRRWMKTIDDKVENPDRQRAMSIWLDAKGDENLLRFQETQVPEKYQNLWRLATQLTDSEKTLALRIRDEFRMKLEDGKTTGLLESGRTDYGVPQFWKERPEEPPGAYATKDGPKGSPGNFRAKLDTNDPFFAFQRSYPTLFEGMMHGGVPAELRISQLVGAYNEAFHKSLSSRAVIAGLKNEMASDGKPLVAISGEVTESKVNEPGTYFVNAGARPSATDAKGDPYVTVNHSALKDWKIAYRTSEGSPIILKGEMRVHPEIAKFLKNELETPRWRDKNSTEGKAVNFILHGNRFLKESKLALGTFHLATIGEHAVFHLVNPFKNGFEIDLRNPDQALLVRNGLELGMGKPQATFEEGLAPGGGLFSKIPGLGDGTRAFSDWLFKDYIPTISMKAGLEALRRNRARYKGKLSENQIGELTAHQMNAAFGLQNYRLLGRSRLLQDLNSLGFLAPQFLESRVKVVAQAFKPYGAEQRMMLAMQAATLYVGARLLNAWLDGDPHWEPENPFRVVYKGRSYGLRTIVSDAWEMREFSRFMAGRVSPIYKTLHETVFQHDMRTGARKMPPIPTGWRPLDIAQNLLVDFARWMLPAGFEGFLPGAAGREQGPGTTLLSSVGIGSHKYTAETQVGGWARDFNRHSNDPATVTHQRQRDADTHVDGAYRKLDALLDAKQFGDGVDEYKALLQDGHKPERIAQRYEHAEGQAFTGSRKTEAAFKASLDAGQRQIYDRAVAERQARLQEFRQLLALARAAR